MNGKVIDVDTLFYLAFSSSKLTDDQDVFSPYFGHRKLSWFGHVCHHDTLPKKIILQGAMEGSRRRGRPRKSWEDSIKEWTGQSMSSLLHSADDRGRRAVTTAAASVGVA